MIIRGAQASIFPAVRPAPHTSHPAGQADGASARDADKVTISSEAMRKTADGDDNPYRLSGAATLLASKNLDVYKMPDALVKEMAVRASEEATREAISAQYASDHRYQTVGQVFVNGEIYAEVDDAGGYGFQKYALSGLSKASLDPRARLEEIARAAQDMGTVEVRYTDFAPGIGGWGGPTAPESMLPAFTARDIRDIFAEAVAAAKGQTSA